MKKIYKWFLTAAPTLLAPIAMVSCGRDVKTSQRLAQEKAFEQESTKTTVEKQYLQSTLASLYNVNNVRQLTNNAQYKKDAFNAYNLYLQTQKAKDIGFMNTLAINQWLHQSLIDTELSAKLIDPAFNGLTETDFWALYNKAETNVAYEANKLLLVLKYFTQDFTNDKTVSEADKSSYDLKYYNLIKYTLDKKYIQEWTITKEGADVLFNQSNTVITGTNSYNQLFENNDIKNLDLNQTAGFLGKSYIQGLNGYKGFVASTSYELPFDKEKLLKITSLDQLIGFYDFAKKQIVQVDAQGQIVNATIAASNGDKNKLQVSFLNVIAPISQKQQTTVKENNMDKTVEVDKLTFNNTLFALPSVDSNSKLLNLVVLLSDADSNLYKNAQTHFAKTYKFKPDANISIELYKALRTLDFVEKLTKLEDEIAKEGKK
ncbi:HinT-interacting membrane complex lipoprotein P60 [Mycoplasma corogypsi]|uniref:HinT-interacting membrane complex lipoprotein P60 n=1 Tax=Mycoplasma corogypsi TaxID=2106 RepID=UPI003872C2BD